MKKIIFIFSLLFLIGTTSVVKNMTKQLNTEIYLTNERLSTIQNKIDNLRLEFDYLTSPEKLIDYQKLYFEEELTPIKSSEIGIFNLNDGKFSNNFKIIKHEQ